MKDIRMWVAAFIFVITVCVAAIIYAAAMDSGVATVVFPEEPEYAPYENDSGQFVVSVKAERVHVWLLAHKDCEIISLTAVSGNRGSWNSFWIVYKRKNGPVQRAAGAL